MSPFFAMLALYGLLSISTVRARLWLGDPWERAAVAMGISLVVAAAMHFVRPDLFVPMVPAFLPEPEVIVCVSGWVELGIALGLLAPKARRASGWAAFVLFVMIWPGSIHVALSGDYPAQPTDAPLYHWLRVPFHALYVGWALWIARARLPFTRSSPTDNANDLAPAGRAS